MKASALEWRWRRWRMRVGEYRGYTGQRPHGFPRVVPPTWFGRLATWQVRNRRAISTPCVTPTFQQTGALWRASDSEDVDRAKRAGLKWALLQLDGDDWSVLSAKLDAHGIPWGWWFHCHTVDDLNRLLAASADRPIVGVNVEKELETTLPPAVVREQLDWHYSGEACLITYGWVANNVRVTDADLGCHAWLLEMFPSDSPDLIPPVQTLAQCVDHAHELGVRYPCQLMQSYHDAKPSWYDRGMVPNSIYTADDVGDRFELWIQERG